MLIVIPRSQGQTCGLRDHARVIRHEAAKRGVTATLCPWPGECSAARETAILLEFTPLSYSQIGLPWQLLVQLVTWRIRSCRVVTYFHEVPFTNGHTWKRQAAVLLQRCFCMLLAALSNEVVANQHNALGWLSSLHGGQKATFLPSCSNIGESKQAPKPSARANQVVIFGSPGKRRHAHSLILESGGYRKIFGADARILDIGEPLELHPLLQSEVECFGPLEPKAVLQNLLESKYGLFYSEPAQFSKSGIFGAYCAAGVVPIIARATAECSAYFLSPSEITSRGSRFLDPQSVWLSSRQWFHRYSAQACTDQLFALLDEHH